LDEKIIHADQSYSCIDSLAKLKDFNKTNNSIWVNTTDGYVSVSECYLTGCIHDLICHASCGHPVCDTNQHPYYSADGMTCNSSCSYYEFNLTLDYIECVSDNCTANRIVYSDNSYSCLANLA
jgi:hypothetical protein